MQRAMQGTATGSDKSPLISPDKDPNTMNSIPGKSSAAQGRKVQTAMRGTASGNGSDKFLHSGNGSDKEMKLKV